MLSQYSDRRASNASRIAQLLAGFIMILALCAGALAQASQGTVSGTTSDPSGAVLTDSRVTATNTATGETRTITSNADGLFVFPLLPVGPYRIEASHTETPSPVNPLGVKGVGEAGTIGCSPAVVNSVVDALSPLGVKHLDMPLTPEKLWKVISSGRPA